MPQSQDICPLSSTHLSRCTKFLHHILILSRNMSRLKHILIKYHAGTTIKLRNIRRRSNIIPNMITGNITLGPLIAFWGGPEYIFAVFFWDGELSIIPSFYLKKLFHSDHLDVFLKGCCVKRDEISKALVFFCFIFL